MYRLIASLQESLRYTARLIALAGYGHHPVGRYIRKVKTAKLGKS